VLAKAVPAEVSVSDEVLLVKISSWVTLVLMDIDGTPGACRRVGICAGRTKVSRIGFRKQKE
jgi:hypothetical protein